MQTRKRLGLLQTLPEERVTNNAGRRGHLSGGSVSWRELIGERTHHEGHQLVTQPTRRSYITVLTRGTAVNLTVS